MHSSLALKASLRSRQRGASLVITLLMIVVVASLSAAAARLALSGERSSRADRDRELAMQAAETALADGERDVLGLAGSTRGADFCKAGTVGFPEAGCSLTTADKGKCATAAAGLPPSWLAVDWDTAGVPVGTYTGGAFYPTQGATKSWLPSTTPRYVIERVSDRLQDTVDGFADKGEKRNLLYLVTSVGYATRSDVKVVLQATIRKASC